MLRLVWSDKYIIPAALTLLIGLGMVWLGLQMPRTTGWASAPGLFPVFIGLGLVIMSVALVIEGWRRGGGVFGRLGSGGSSVSLVSIDSVPASMIAHAAPAQTLIVVLLYVLAFLRFLPYEIATALFLALAMWVNSVRSWRLIAMVSLGTPLFLSLIFVLLLETLLPGTTSVVEQWVYR